MAKKLAVSAFFNLASTIFIFSLPNIRWRREIFGVFGTTLRFLATFRTTVGYAGFQGGLEPQGLYPC